MMDEQQPKAVTGLAQDVHDDLVAEGRLLGQDPWLPIEQKLVMGSLGLGLLLLGVLFWVSRTYFPVIHP